MSTITSSSRTTSAFSRPPTPHPYTSPSQSLQRSVTDWKFEHEAVHKGYPLNRLMPALVGHGRRKLADGTGWSKEEHKIFLGTCIVGADETARRSDIFELHVSKALAGRNFERILLDAVFAGLHCAHGDMFMHHEVYLIAQTTISNQLFSSIGAKCIKSEQLDGWGEGGIQGTFVYAPDEHHKVSLLLRFISALFAIRQRHTVSPMLRL